MGNRMKLGRMTCVMAKKFNNFNTEIDRLVYELNGLTEDEIKIVEQTTA